ncbi:MAG: c-type cytochrome [Acidobacteriaceae bacterium]|nr:c-type cytochrome [Acidobacteriaceae bacterium]
MRLAVVFAIAVLLCAQEKPPVPEKTQEAKPPQKEAPRQPPPAPANLKVLKTTSGQEVRDIMRTFTAGLGVKCGFCHAEGNFASDENPKKATARQMIEMTQKLNTSFGDAKMHVTCYTCHRGEAEPKTAPEAKTGL